MHGRGRRHQRLRQIGRPCPIEELGQLETPIALTNTLGVGLVSDALVQHTAEVCEKYGERLRSVNPVVGECNDSELNENALSQSVGGRSSAPSLRPAPILPKAASGPAPA